ncbi:WD40/YVTN/BNR-like repeat-containing protein [Desulfosporosinus metallidurans]|uniref:BNR repeat protein n=1 Tax=Desulfosporosinus metallidurans TaxID=1888891 RepID=A0A1Q8QNS9_9FIRM|nr:hypothetical protein [Desulfosporosinus metallidurans]OLN28952.1 BNR repeat protein [Desulfosporosinus metallidurans]
MEKKISIPVAVLIISLLLVGCSGLSMGKPAEPQTNQPVNTTDNTSKEALGLSSIRMVTETTGWALGNGRILRTIDGGNQWEDITPPEKLANPRGTTLAFLDANTVWVATSTEDGSKGSKIIVFRTNNGGQSWQSAPVSVENNGAERFPRSLNFIDSERGWLMIEPDHGMNSSPGQLFATTDSGATWSKISITDGSQNALPFGGTIRFRNSATGWVVGANTSTTRNKLYMTRDGGLTWQQQKLVLPNGFSGGEIDVVSPPVFLSTDSKEGILMTTFVPESHKTIEYATIFYVTQDGGLTWQSRKPVKPESLTIDFINANDWWHWRSEHRDTGSTAPVNGKLYHTSNGGKTWSETNPDKTLQELLQKGQNIMELDFADCKIGWVLVRSKDSSPNTLLKTTDGGNTWTRIYPK